jgi:hypothetical protein
MDLVIDPSGNSFVLDSNNGNIQLYGPGPSYTFQLSWPPRNSSVWLDQPNGIVMDLSGNIYVAVKNDCSVRKYKAQ